MVEMDAAGLSGQGCLPKAKNSRSDETRLCTKNNDTDTCHEQWFSVECHRYR